MPNNQDVVNNNVIECYTGMTPIYELMWGKKGDLSLHAGFWEKDTKTQKEANFNENRCIAEALQLNNSDVVLDAGCGVCGPAVWIAKIYGCKITGITITPSQVERASKYINEQNLSNLVNVELKDYCKTGYPKESFSKIYTIESACYALDKAAFLKQMYDLLKPGGRFAEVEGLLNTGIMSPEILDLYADFRRGFAIPTLTTVDEYVKIMEGVGFKDITVEDKTELTLPGLHSLMRLNKTVMFPTKVLYKLRIIPRAIYLDTIANCSLYSMYKERHILHVLISATK
jgi:cyclopropane fatty-acyl-phospholipid synthase-like methyltransferase